MNSESAKITGKAALLEALQLVSASDGTAEVSNVTANDVEDFLVFMTRMLRLILYLRNLICTLPHVILTVFTASHL